MQAPKLKRPSLSVRPIPMRNMTIAGKVLVKGIGRIMRQAMIMTMMLISETPPRLLIQLMRGCINFSVSVKNLIAVLIIFPAKSWLIFRSSAFRGSQG